jgi:hypothetical protein
MVMLSDVIPEASDGLQPNSGVGLLICFVSHISHDVMAETLLHLEEYVILTHFP